ncbi:MAG: hypothetical protein H6839_02115 [Planctomycetes bacterium]|nr:hypothetical protein [Planctomycetota bacterium]
MPYVFYDLPADSSELETFNGYHVSRLVHKAQGCKVKRPEPFAPPAELVLQATRRPWFEPALSRMRPAPAARSMARRAPTRAWCTRGFISARTMAALLCTPCLSFALAWLMGRF